MVGSQMYLYVCNCMFVNKTHESNREPLLFTSDSKRLREPIASKQYTQHTELYYKTTVLPLGCCAKQWPVPSLVQPEGPTKEACNKWKFWEASI